MEVVPGASTIQQALSANPTATFCLRAGTYDLTSPVTPSSGDVLVGEFGAVLDGTLIAGSGEGSLVNGFCTGATNVTIRNLYIRDHFYKGVGGGCSSTGWAVDHVEVSGTEVGIAAGSNWTVSNSYVHHNRKLGLAGYQGHGSLYVGNEVAFNNTNGTCCWDEGGAKFADVRNVTVRGNYFHDNAGTELWFDFSDGPNLIEDNRIVQSPLMWSAAISYEISANGVIRNNIISGAGSSAIEVSTSQHVEVYGNTITWGASATDHAVLEALYDPSRGEPSLDNYFHDNHVTLSSGNAAAVREFGPNPDRSSHRFENNTYVLPSPDGLHFIIGSTRVTFTQWKAAGYDG